MGILFTNIEDLRAHLPIRVSFKLEQVSSFIEMDGQELVLRDFLGDSLLDSLLDSYANYTITADGYDELLKKCQFFLANYGVLLYLPFAIGDIGNSGLTITNTSDTKSAPEWVSDQIQNACSKRADMGIENLLKYLEENVSTFSSWVGSKGYTLATGSFLASATEFDQYYTINANRRTFLALMPYKRIAEEGEIKTVLGDTIYTTLKGKLTDPGSFTSDELKVVEWVRSALAFLTVKNAIPHIRVEINADGLQVNSLSDRTVRKVKSAADNNQIAMLIAACAAESDKFLTKIKVELADVNDTTAESAGFGMLDSGKGTSMM